MRKVVFAPSKCQQSGAASTSVLLLEIQEGSLPGLIQLAHAGFAEYQQLNPAGPLAALLGIENQLLCFPLAVLECCYSSLSGTWAEERPG